MLRYQLIKLTRQIRIWLTGSQHKEQEHKMFRLFDPAESRVAIEWLGEVMRAHGFYYNCLSLTYREQIYTVRKLLGPDHQMHLRFYSDGWVTGHTELQPDTHPLEHLESVDCKPLSDAEKASVKRIFDELGWIWPD